MISFAEESFLEEDFFFFRENSLTPKNSLFLSACFDNKKYTQTLVQKQDNSRSWVPSSSNEDIDFSFQSMKCFGFILLWKISKILYKNYRSRIFQSVLEFDYEMIKKADKITSTEPGIDPFVPLASIYIMLFLFSVIICSPLF